MRLIELYPCRARSHNAPEQYPTIDSLLQGNETGRVRSTDTRATVTDGVVGDRELSQVVADHLRLDLDGVELLARVDTNDGADHLRNDDHVTEVSLDDSGLLIRRASCFALRSFLIKPIGLRLRPRLNRLRARAWTTSRSCSLERSRSSSKSMPR